MSSDIWLKAIGHKQCASPSRVRAEAWLAYIEDRESSSGRPVPVLVTLRVPQAPVDPPIGSIPKSHRRVQSAPDQSVNRHPTRLLIGYQP